LVELAALLGVTSVNRAFLLVIAFYREDTVATAVVAFVASRANIAVVTCKAGYRYSDTPRHRRAAVRRARIVVVAGEELDTEAGSAVTAIHAGAYRAISTGRFIGTNTAAPIGTTAAIADWHTVARVPGTVRTNGHV